MTCGSLWILLVCLFALVLCAALNGWLGEPGSSSSVNCWLRIISFTFCLTCCQICLYVCVKFIYYRNQIASCGVRVAIIFLELLIYCTERFNRLREFLRIHGVI